jgi:hypothetical protein
VKGDLLPLVSLAGELTAKGLAAPGLANQD